MTATVTIGEGSAFVFVAVDHCTTGSREASSAARRMDGPARWAGPAMHVSVVRRIDCVDPYYDFHHGLLRGGEK